MKNKKKDKKNKNLRSPDNILFSIIANIESLLKQRNFKEAKVHLNRLISIDKKKYDELLLDYNKRFFDDCIERKNIPAANKLLTELTTFITHEELLLKRSQILLAEKNVKNIIKELISLKKSNLINNIKIDEILDYLVVSFEDIVELKEFDPDLYSDILKIQTALEAISNELYEDALSATKSIGFSSPLASWRILIKGLCSYYKGDDSNAEKAFLKASTTNILSKISGSFLNTLHVSTFLENEFRNEKMLNNFCSITNNESIKKELVRIEYIFRTGREFDAVKSYFDLSNLPEKAGTDILFDLGSFLIDFAKTSHTETQEERFGNFFESLYRRISKNDNSSNIKKFFVLKYLISTFLPDEKISLVKEYSENYIKSAQKIFEDSKLIKALVFSRIGAYFLARADFEEEKAIPFFLPLFNSRQKQKDLGCLKEAEHYFKKSIENSEEPDKNNYLFLLSIYEGNDSKFNKLMDEMVVLFPEDKDILFKAGMLCMKRNAYNKAIDYLLKAETLDPIDKDLKVALVGAYSHLGVKYLKNKKTDLLQKLYENLLQIGVDKSDDLILGKAFLYLRCALFEYSLNNKEAGDLFTKKAEAFGFDNEFLTLAQYRFTKTISVKNDYTEKISKEASAILSKNINYKTAINLLHLAVFNNRFDKKELNELNMKIYNYCQKLASKVLNKDECQILITKLFGLYNTKPERLILTIIEKLVSIIEKKSKDNLYVLFFKNYIVVKGKSKFKYEDNIDNLEKLISQAKEINDLELVSIMEKHLKLLKSKQNKMPDHIPELFGELGEKINELREIYGNNFDLDDMMDLFDDDYEDDEEEDYSKYPVCKGCGKRHP